MSGGSERPTSRSGLARGPAFLACILFLPSLGCLAFDLPDAAFGGPVDILKRIPDFRVQGRTKHPLWEMLAIVVCALICGATSDPDYALFGQRKRKFLKRFLPLRHGVPSHDRFRYVLKNLDPKRFNEAVLSWTLSLVELAGDTLAIDGKVLRRAFGADGPARRRSGGPALRADVPERARGPPGDHPDGLGAIREDGEVPPPGRLKRLAHQNATPPPSRRRSARFDASALSGSQAGLSPPAAVW